MSVRVGRIMRHEDVHGVSGAGDHLADVFEASDGTCIVRWLGKDGSTNVYAGAKNVLNVHGHGGKTEIDWLWEQEDDADPMDAVFDKKIIEAGGSTLPPSPTGSTAPSGPTAATAPPSPEEEEEDQAQEDAAVDAIASKLAAKVSKRVVEKVAESMAAEGDESAPETGEEVPAKDAEK
jgi:hypothetical protein